jgi:hypothetical protein
MFGGRVDINGMQIDPQQMMQMQQNAQLCASHPECKGCPLYTTAGYNGTICENALIRLSQGGNQNESRQSDTT